MKTYSAIDIANFYIQLVHSLPDDSIDNLKLNKLLYYVQGWSLNRLGRVMFREDIQAWDLGPVIPAVYHQFKACGKRSIEAPEAEFDESRLSTEELELLIDVYRFYGKYTGWALKEMTHEAGSPWDMAYEQNKNRIIPVESLKEHFAKETLPSFELKNLSIPVVQYIPAEWDTVEDAVYD